MGYSSHSSLFTILIHTDYVVIASLWSSLFLFLDYEFVTGKAHLSHLFIITTELAQ